MKFTRQFEKQAAQRAARSAPPSAGGMPTFADPTLQRAAQSLSQGRRDEAERAIRQSLAGGESADGFDLLGFVTAQKGDLSGALALFERALGLDPAHVAAHTHRIAALRDSGRIADALAAAQAFVRVAPDSHHAHREHAEVLVRMGRLREALEAYDRGSKADPRAVSCLLGLGTVWLQLGDGATAVSALKRAVDLQPANPKLRMALAQAHVSLGQRTQAKAEIESLRSGASVEALKELGETLTQAGWTEEAYETFAAACKQSPADPELQFKRGRALQMLHRTAEAKAAYQKAIALKPDLDAAYANVGAILAEEGRYGSARDEYAKAIRHARDGGAARRIRRALLTPVIAASDEEIVEVRERILHEIGELQGSSVRLTDPAIEVGTGNFYLAYQGRSNRELQERIAALYRKACPDLEWVAPSVRNPRARGAKIRIGFCSAFFYEHTVGRINEGLLDKIDRQKFDVSLIRTQPASDELGKKLDRSADRVVLLPPSLAAARELVGDLGLDVLYYTDIGMDAFTYYLSFARLAPVQAAGWGHADTTGVPNVDDYVSAMAFEPPAAQGDYCERLVSLERIPDYHYAPPPTAPTVSKAEFGLDEAMPLVLCAQSLFKVHPDFDVAVAGILRGSPSARFAFVEGSEPHWIELLRARFARTMPDAVDRIIFLPRQSPDRFRGLLRTADAVVDTKHFTGGHTAYIALGLGVPVVTWDGPLMRGRMTRGLYRQMGVEGLDFADHAGVVEATLRLIRERDFRESWRTTLAERAPALFEDLAAVRGFEAYLERAIEEKR